MERQVGHSLAMQPSVSTHEGSSHRVNFIGLVKKKEEGFSVLQDVRDLEKTKHNAGESLQILVRFYQFRRAHYDIDSPWLGRSTYRIDHGRNVNNRSEIVDKSPKPTLPRAKEVGKYFGQYMDPKAINVAYVEGHSDPWGIAGMAMKTLATGMEIAKNMSSVQSDLLILNCCQVLTIQNMQILAETNSTKVVIAAQNKVHGQFLEPNHLIPTIMEESRTAEEIGGKILQKIMRMTPFQNDVKSIAAINLHEMADVIDSYDEFKAHLPHTTSDEKTEIKQLLRVSLRSNDLDIKEQFHADFGRFLESIKISNVSAETKTLASKCSDALRNAVIGSLGNYTMAFSVLEVEQLLTDS